MEKEKLEKFGNVKIKITLVAYPDDYRLHKEKVTIPFSLKGYCMYTHKSLEKVVDHFCSHFYSHDIEFMIYDYLFFETVTNAKLVDEILEDACRNDLGGFDTVEYFGDYDCLNYQIDIDRLCSYGILPDENSYSDISKYNWGI